MSETVKKTARNGKGTNGRFLRGNKCSKGRKKGSKGKFTNLKEAYLDVFEKIEKESKRDISIDNFFSWATKNQRNQGMFYQMISKMLPTNMDIEHSGKIDGKLTIEVIKTK